METPRNPRTRFTDTTVRISSMIAIAPDAYIIGTAGGALFGMIALRSPFGALLGAVVGAGFAHSYVWVLTQDGYSGY